VFSTLGQRTGARQVPSLLDEEIQPAGPPAKPRAALAGGYLLVAAAAAAGSTKPTARAMAMATTLRDGEEGIGGFSFLLFD
jgi:hypothetical protein